MKEFEILLNGKVFSNRFNTEELAECHVLENDLNKLGIIQIREMTREEIEKYQNKIKE